MDEAEVQGKILAIRDFTFDEDGYLTSDLEKQSFAVELLHEIIDCGDPYVQYLLGLYYAIGTVLPQDPQKSHDLLELSARQGYEPAIEKLKSYKKNIFGKWIIKM